MSQTYYFDADIIIAYLDEDDREKNNASKRTIRKVKNTIKRNPEIKVKIPSIALAEISTWLMENSRLTKLSHKLLELIKELNADFPAPKKEHYVEALSLLAKDDYLKPHDSLIIAHALLDYSTSHLFTFDTDLIGNRVIESRKSELGNKFKIGPEL